MAALDIPPTPAGKMHALAASPETVHWGYFDPALRPVLAVRSGDVVSIETLTHHAGDVPDLLFDEGTRAVFDGVDERGPGPHILTGPIVVEGAEPGDTLEVRILELRLRLPYGANLAASWGWLSREFNHDRITCFRLENDCAVAAFGFDRPRADPDLIGRIVPAETTTRQPALAGVRVPLRPHFGVIGVSPAERVSSVPPGPFGGNVDNWRFGAGARMLYPVSVDGALLSIGDPHAAQGDGELTGTALEASLTGEVQIVLHKKLVVRTPVLETAELLMTHGFGDTLDEAMNDAADALLALLVDRAGLTRDDAYALASVAADFGITQVVDQRLGVHAAVPLSCLPG
jgi:acetamidase/formamidase